MNRALSVPSWTAGIVAGLMLAVVAPSSAQSFLSGRALGYTLEPVDSRSRALGGVALGLLGGGPSFVNPAVAAFIPFPALTVTTLSDQLSAEQADGARFDGSTVRFPMIAAALPLGDRFAITLGYGSFLDQNFAAERDDRVFLGDSVLIRSRLESEGGLSRFRTALAYRPIESLAVSVGADLYTGGVDRSLTRTFFDITGETRLTNFTSEPFARERSYRAVGYVVGLSWLRGETAAVGLSVSGAGSLEARSEEAEGEGSEEAALAGEYDIPTQAALGASARVAPSLLVAASAQWSGWSTASDQLATAGGARDVWSYGGGVEWDGITSGNRVFPVRLGGRYTELPFQYSPIAGEPTGWVDERAITGGIGAHLAGGLARMDLTAERGWRGEEAIGLAEDFWRLGLSLTVISR